MFVVPQEISSSDLARPSRFHEFAAHPFVGHRLFVGDSTLDVGDLPEVQHLVRRERRCLQLPCGGGAFQAFTRGGSLGAGMTCGIDDSSSSSWCAAMTLFI